MISVLIALVVISVLLGLVCLPYVRMMSDERDEGLTPTIRVAAGSGMLFAFVVGGWAVFLLTAELIVGWVRSL